MAEVDKEKLVPVEEDDQSDKPKKPSTFAVVLIVIFTLVIIAVGILFILYAKKICDEHAKTVQPKPQQGSKPDKSYLIDTILNFFS